METASARAARLFPFSFLLFPLAFAGCSHVNNPWKDSSTIILPDLTTANADGYRGHGEFGHAMRRDWPPAGYVYTSGAVTHWPTWFEDPFVDKGNECPTPDGDDPIDTTFAMNGVDYLHIAYGPARLLLNAVAWPISAIVTPPGTLMVSDGRLSKSIICRYDHDAERADPNAVDPPDVVTNPNRSAAVNPPAPVTAPPVTDEHPAPAESATGTQAG